MSTLTAESVQEEYAEDIAGKVDAWLTKKKISHWVAGEGKNPYSDQCFYEQGQEELRELASVAARAAGMEEEADHIDRCGKSYAVARCEKCGEFIGHPYHCDERLCPSCYYRNLSRFMKRHEKSWETATHLTLVTVNYGGFRPYNVEEAWAESYELHKRLIAAFPLIDGGIYHRELTWDEEYHLWHIRYHYLLAAHVNYVFLIMQALGGAARVEDYKSFENYAGAQSYFVQHCCKSPADILLDCTKTAWYLGLMKRSRLIQGWGQFYRMAGGCNRGAHDRQRRTCPICGGKLVFAGYAPREYATWDGEHRCYCVDPGAPGL